MSFRRVSVADVLARLDKVKKSGAGWTARCPAHDDKNPSLSISEADDGKVLLYCHAGCEYPDVARALGIGREHARFVPTRRFSTMSTAALADTYEYTDEQAKPLFRVKRFKLVDGGKTFSQERPDGSGGWIKDVKGVRRVPYRLPKVIEAAKLGGVVHIVEGEKDVHSLEGLGLVATTNAGGAGKWLDDYSAHLKGASLAVVLPDNDEPGRRHGQLVACSLVKTGVPVKVVPLPGVPEKGDASDWIKAGGTKDQLAALVEAAVPFEPPKDTEAGWEVPIPLGEYDLPPFPVSALPAVLRAFVRALAVATQTPPDLAAMMCFAAIATACARKIVVSVRAGYVEPVNVYMVVALPPANRKSPVHREATAALREWEETEARRLDAEIKKNRSQRKILERSLEAAQAKAAKAEDFKACEMAKADVARIQAELDRLPVLTAPRLIVDDITPEKLALLMSEHDERMSVMSAEGGVFGLMAGRYAKNDAGGNFEVFLKAHSGDHLTVDRIGRKSDILKRPALTMGLTVQTDVIERMSNTPEFRGRGLLARFFYSLPKSLVGEREIATPPVPEHVAAAYRRDLMALLEIPVVRNEEGDCVPYTIRLSAEAAEAHMDFERWIEPRLAETGELGFMADWAGKLAGGIVRIAGLLHLAEHATAAKPWEIPISGETMRAAVQIGCYLIPHAKAAFIEMNADESTKTAKHALKWIVRKEAETFTKRQLHQALKGRLKKTDEVDEVLDVLIDYGYIRPRPSEDSKAGRPSEVYEVNPLTWQETRRKRTAPGFEDIEDAPSALTTGPARGFEDIEDALPPSDTANATPHPATQTPEGGFEDFEDAMPRVRTAETADVSLMPTPPPSAPIAHEVGYL